MARNKARHSGLFQNGNQAAAGVKDRGWEQRRANKDYTDAVRELFAKPVDLLVPENWPKDPKQWTEAQDLALRHLSLAKAGSLEIGTMMIERAEGKVPRAPEDREADAANAGKLLAGMNALTGINALKMALGMKVIDTQVIPEERKQLGPKSS